MLRRAILLLTLVLIFLFSSTIRSSWGQGSDNGVARGIFDTETKQAPSLNTVIKARTYVPQRPKPNKQPSQKSAHPSSAQEAKTTALKYSVLAAGKETPKGYEVGRNLTKVSVADEGKPYGLTDPQQNFHQGDIIYLLFEPSNKGYLYIVNLGSDGVTRNLIYPESGKSAYITPDAPVLLGPFRIDPPPGIDRLTVVFSQNRIASFEERSKKNVTQEFESEVDSHDYKAIEEEEVYLPTKETLALYFAATGKDLLKAEIDIKHLP